MWDKKQHAMLVERYETGLKAVILLLEQLVLLLLFNNA